MNKFNKLRIYQPTLKVLKSLWGNISIPSWLAWCSPSQHHRFFSPTDGISNMHKYESLTTAITLVALPPCNHSLISLPIAHRNILSWHQKLLPHCQLDVVVILLPFAHFNVWYRCVDHQICTANLLGTFFSRIGCLLYGWAMMLF